MPIILPLALIAVSATAVTQNDLAQPGRDHGTFILHKLAKRIRQETFQRTHDRTGNVVTTSDFLFTDRGEAVPLKTVYTASAQNEPISLSVEGKSSRQSQLNYVLMRR